MAHFQGTVRFTVERDPVGAVHEAVEDGVGQDRIADDAVEWVTEWAWNTHS